MVCEIACPICNLGRLSFYKRSMKKLVQQKILYFHGVFATLFLHSRTIRRQVFRQIGHRVAGDGDSGGVPGTAGGGGGVDTGGVIHEIGRKAGFPNLTVAELPGQLVDDGADHFQMPQLFGPQWSI